VRREKDHPEREELWSEWNSGYRSRLLEWERRRLPSLLEEHAEYFPNTMLYKTSGGYIAINGKEHRTAVLAEIWKGQMRKNGIIRAAIDTDNYYQMVEWMRRLPGVNEGLRTVLFCLRIGRAQSGRLYCSEQPPIGFICQRDWN
jgi:hypothetical protein